HTAIVSAVAFSPDGQHVASGSWDETLLIWNVANGQVAYSLPGRAGFVYDVAFSPDGQYLASAHANGTVILWDPRSGQELWRPPAHGYEAVSVAFSPNSRLLASAGGRDHTARVWDVQARKEAVRLQMETVFGEVSPGRVWQTLFSPDGKWVVTAGHGNLTLTSKVILWDAETG